MYDLFLSFQIKIDHVRGESTLNIAEVFPEDEGEYMCKAENRLGAAITHCHLFVKRKCWNHSLYFSLFWVGH